MNFEPLSYARATECENQKDDWTLVTCEKIELLKPNQSFSIRILIFLCSDTLIVFCLHFIESLTIAEEKSKKPKWQTKQRPMNRIRLEELYYLFITACN